MSILDMSLHEFVNSFPPEAGFAAVAIFLATAGWEHYRRVRQRKANRELQRRMAGDNVIYRDQYRRLSQHAGDDLQNPSYANLTIKPLSIGLLGGIVIWSKAIGADLLFTVGIITAIWLNGLFALWHRINDPPELHAADTPIWQIPPIELPREAAMGFAAAIAIVAIVVITIAYLF